MADAVDAASCVIVFVSRAYKESANCRAEAEYAHGSVRDGLQMLHAMCEQDYTTVSNERVTGWLGFLIGQHLWYAAWSDPATAAQGIAQKLNSSGVKTPLPRVRVMVQPLPL